MCEGRPLMSFGGQEEQRGHLSMSSDGQILVSVVMRVPRLERGINYLRRRSRKGQSGGDVRTRVKFEP
jgi:hypothetical protein